MNANLSLTHPGVFAALTNGVQCYLLTLRQLHC